MSYDRAYGEMVRDGERDGERGHQPIAIARRGEMRRIQEQAARGMAGNPPRDLREKHL